MRKKDKVLILTSYMSGNGGVERVIQRMFSMFKDDLSLDFCVISLSGGERNIEENEHVKSIYRGQEGWLKNLKSYRLPINLRNKYLNFIMHFSYVFFYLCFNKVDYVICTGPAQSVYLKKLRTIFRFNYKIYAWPHFSITSNFGEFRFCKHADYCLGISKDICKQFETIGVSKDKINFFPNPFERHELLNDSVGIGITKFIYIGRLLFEGQKRIKDIIDASKSLEGNFVIHLIGDGADSDVIGKYIESSLLNEKIIMHKGWHDRPWDIVEKPSALLLSSAFEGLPTVLGEAMSRGVLCISSDCETGPRDFILDGVNGFLFPVKDVDALAAMMQRVIDGEISIAPSKIAESIEFFYADNYHKRFKQLLKNK
ncbi:glycosyltransferase [Serratia marcescens]|uniref:glycosyltransferase n=1 Tax=Serratia marcescens TaxID=615 RepID=UPI000D734789|nr:glycosyltransferase [Serratia marcescens]AWQ47175.1 hypothetical protein B1A42_07460 [Serratia marcescens]